MKSLYKHCKRNWKKALGIAFGIKLALTPIESKAEPLDFVKDFFKSASQAVLIHESGHANKAEELGYDLDFKIKRDSTLRSLNYGLPIAVGATERGVLYSSGQRLPSLQVSLAGLNKTKETYQDLDEMIENNQTDSSSSLLALWLNTDFQRYILGDMIFGNEKKGDLYNYEMLRNVSEKDIAVVATLDFLSQLPENIYHFKKGVLKQNINPPKKLNVKGFNVDGKAYFNEDIGYMISFRKKW